MASPTAGVTSVENRRVRLDPDDRREQILEAAQRLFAERPYSSVSTTDLAAAAGTTRTNLHYYFGTKRALYLEVLRRFGQLPELPSPGSVRATGPAELERLFARWLDVLERNPQTIMTMIGTVAPGADPEVEAVFRDGMRAWEDRLLAVLELRDEPATRAMIRSFQGMVSSAIAEWLNGGTLTKQQVHGLLVRTLLAVARS
ncbi:TetR/AcrR family transcriptional regulator [Pseudonocardia sp. RS010]|uniref:TetR/AcrR family transcriptional regulator n=1 Tax=Pseudonocardia sp. RS010 TaxID=3385979 RepID=UPI0039A3E4E9